MNTAYKKITSVVLSLCLLLTLCVIVLPTTASASSTVITETLNVAGYEKNESGPGYDWANRFDKLTLTNLNLDTDSPYGLRLPKDCTVILNGNNTIKAAKYGITCSGTVSFKGEGTLTIEAGNVGIYLLSQETNHKIRIQNGKFTITAGEYGVYSEYADFSFVNGEINFNMTNPNAVAIKGRCVNLLGGTFKSNAPVTSTMELVVNSINLDINASTSALVSPKLTMKYLDIKADGKSVDEYDGENTVSTKGLSRYNKTSIFFGDSVPGWVDYIAAAFVVLMVAAVIVLPILHQKKKKKLLYERLAKEGYIDSPEK